ncbi:unnamed protein product [Bathycoccus prasinos]
MTTLNAKLGSVTTSSSSSRVSLSSEKRQRFRRTTFTERRRRRSSDDDENSITRLSFVFFGRRQKSSVSASSSSSYPPSSSSSNDDERRENIRTSKSAEKENFDERRRWRSGSSASSSSRSAANASSTKNNNVTSWRSPSSPSYGKNQRRPTSTTASSSSSSSAPSSMSQFSKTATPAEICQSVLSELEKNPDKPGLRVTVFSAVQALAIDRDCVLHCCALLRECLSGKYGENAVSIVSPATIALLVRVERARTKALGYRNRSSSRMRYVAAVFKLAEEKYKARKGGEKMFCSLESYCDVIQILAKFCSEEDEQGYYGRLQRQAPYSSLKAAAARSSGSNSSNNNSKKLLDPKCLALGPRVEPTLDTALDFWRRLETHLTEEKKTFPAEFDNNAVVSGVRAFVSAKKRSEAERFLSKANPKLLSASCFNVLIESFGDEKNVKGIESTLKMMRGFNVPENEATFGALVTAFAKCNRLDKAEEFLELAGRKKYATARSKPGVRAYTSYIQRLCLARRVDEARKVLFDGMLRRDKIDVKPNVHTFTAFIDGLNYSEFETPGSLKEEKKIITEMFKVLEVMQAVNVKPTTATFNAILKRVSVLFSSNSSVKNTRVDDYARVVIDEVFKKMEEAECSPNLITYNTLIDASVASDRPNDAYEWLSRLAESGLKPDQYTYATLLKFFALRRDASGTKWVLAEIDRLRVRVDVRVYNAAFNALAKSGEIDETVDLIRELESTTGVSPDAASYLVIIDAYAADSKIEDAVRVYETFCRGESEENAAKTDARTRSRMVKILCDSKKTNASLFRDADGWIERIIEEDSVSEDERIQLRQATAQYLTTKSSNTAANRQKKMLSSSSSLSSSSQQQKTPRVVIREAVLLPRDNDANVGSRDEGMYAMYSMEKEDDSDEIKLTKTNVPCDTDQTFKWDRGVEMWKFWLGIPNRYYRDANSPFTDEDEENPLSGSGNGPVEV